MKKILATLSLSLHLGLVSDAQVKIGGTTVAPVASAVLELDGGSSKGLLLPRMRKIDIDAIENPAEGLTIYATDEQAVYLRKSLVWEKQAPFNLPYMGTFNSPNAILHLTNNTSGGIAIQGVTLGGSSVVGYASTGNGILGIASNASGLGGFFYNTQPNAPSLVSQGFTGIGNGTPTALLHINGTQTAGNTVIIDDNDDPTIQLRKAGINKSYIKQEGNNLVFRPNDQNSSGKVVLQSYNDGGWLFLDAAGNTSLGINPTGFTGTPLNSRMNIRSNNQETLSLDAASDNVSGPTLNFVNKTGAITGELGYIKASNTFLKLSSTYAMNFDASGVVNQLLYSWSNRYQGVYLMALNHYGELSVRSSVKIGNLGSVGTSALDISAFASPYGDAEAMHIRGVNPIVRISNGTEKAFIQVEGDDMKVGTFINNDLGKFIVRTNGGDRMFVNPDGKIIMGGGTGLAPAGTQLLKVKGGIQATDFTVTALAAWPDYVFADNYKLPSLEETEAFIKANKHLPNIPAAATIEKEGLELGDMQKRMMEKIEELTLHLIEANKEIKTLKKQMTSFQK